LPDGRGARGGELHGAAGAGGGGGGQSTGGGGGGPTQEAGWLVKW
jgi:hypothetical protein